MERRLSHEDVLASLNSKGDLDLHHDVHGPSDLRVEMHRLTRAEIDTNGVLRSSVSRAVVGTPRSPWTSRPTQPTNRHLEALLAARDGGEAMGGPAELYADAEGAHQVHFVEVEAQLLSTDLLSREEQHSRHLSSISPHRGSGLPRVEEVIGFKNGQDMEVLRDQARAFLRAHGLAPQHQSKDGAPRRVLSVLPQRMGEDEHQEQQDRDAKRSTTDHVLFAVSPAALPRHLAESHNLHDVPSHVNNLGPGSPLSSSFDKSDAYGYFTCLEQREDERLSCFSELVRHARQNPGLAADVLRALDPVDGIELRSEFSTAFATAASIAASIGDLDAQTRLANALLSLDEATPEIMKEGADNSFFLLVHSFDRLTHPKTVVFDAVLQSMVQHSEHLHQYEQLLLTLGTMGSRLPDGHPNKDRAAEEIVRRFDEVVATNAEAEEVYASYLSMARSRFDAMGPEERYRRMADSNHVSRKAWEEVWTTASVEEQRVYLERTLEALSKQLAQNLDDTHNGYKIMGSYHAPPRRLVSDDGAVSYEGGSNGVIESMMAIMTVQAPAVRNSIMAMSNLARSEDVDHLLRLGRHRKKEIRSAALHGLFQFPGKHAKHRLLEAILDEAEDSHIRIHAVEALTTWHHSHLNDNQDVLDAVLTHLGGNDGVNWRSCELGCTKKCVLRDPLSCRRSCTRHCRQGRELETAVLTLATTRLSSVIELTESADSRGLEHHARRLAGVIGVESGVKLQGARRLAEFLLSEDDMEARYASTFDFVRFRQSTVPGS